MTSFNSIAKQMYINKLNLSYDLLNEIKSYCFYDTKTWETITFIKYKKQRICHLLNTATISRANPYDIYFNDENTDQQWVFWTFDEEDGHNKQFQAFSCKHCGNYKIIANEIYYTDKVICHCVDDEDDEDDEDEPEQFMDDDSIGV
jgi:type IV secretory pathway VirB6-like protein